MGSVQKRADGKWRARYRDAAGKEHARHFGRKLDAQRWVESQETAKSRGDWIDPALSRVTVGAWAAEWLSGQVQLKLSTRARYAGVLRVQVLPTWDRVPLKAVTHTDVSRWVAQLVADGLGARTVHKAHRVLSLVLDLAVRDGRLPRNPAAGVRLPRAPTARKQFLTAAEVAVLADASGRDRVLVYVLAYCGLRFGEAAGLQVGDVDLTRRRLRVERSITDVDGHLVATTPKSTMRGRCRCRRSSPRCWRTRSPAGWPMLRSSPVGTVGCSGATTSGVALSTGLLPRSACRG